MGRVPGAADPPVPPVPPAAVTEVRGGTTGLAAEHAALRRTAAVCDDEGDVLRGWAARTARVAVDPDVVAGGLLAPETLAVAVPAVLLAAGGPGHTLDAAAWLEGLAVAVRVSTRAHEVVDDAVAAGLDQAAKQLGRTAGRQPVGPAGLLVVGSGLLASRLGGTPPTTAVETGVDVVGGVLDGVVTGPLTPPLAGVLPSTLPLVLARDRLVDGMGLRLLATRYSTAPPTVRPTPPPPLVAPRSVTDLVDNLARVADGREGRITVQTVRDPVTGARRHIVYLPGTDDLTTTPGRQDRTLRDNGPNLKLLTGQEALDRHVTRDEHTAAVLRALADAGVGEDEPVLAVGHSQGGMVADRLAELPRTGPVDAVTLGSPAAYADLGAGRHGLHLENVDDVVPALDGGPNPEDVNRTTVRFATPGAQGVTGEHGLDAYRQGAAAVDRLAGDPRGSVPDEVARLRRAGFLGSQEDGVHGFHLERGSVAAR